MASWRLYGVIFHSVERGKGGDDCCYGISIFICALYPLNKRAAASLREKLEHLSLSNNHLSYF